MDAHIQRNLELLRLADRRAPEGSDANDVATLAEALALWVERRQLPGVIEAH